MPNFKNFDDPMLFTWADKARGVSWPHGKLTHDFHPQLHDRARRSLGIADALLVICRRDCPHNEVEKLPAKDIVPHIRINEHGDITQHGKLWVDGCDPNIVRRYACPEQTVCILLDTATIFDEQVTAVRRIIAAMKDHGFHARYGARGNIILSDKVRHALFPEDADGNSNQYRRPAQNAYPSNHQSVSQHLNTPPEAACEVHAAASAPSVPHPVSSDALPASSETQQHGQPQPHDASPAVRHGRGPGRPRRSET